MENRWFLYMVQTASGALYTGITTDVARRFLQHQRGTGARALRGKGPLTLVFQCPAGDRSQASRLEYQVKQRTRVHKLLLVREKPSDLHSWLASHP